jgi:hypothetical protein
VEPESDRFGGIDELLGRDDHAAVLHRQLARVGHGPYDVDFGQGVGQAGRSADVFQGRIAAGQVVFDPMRLTRSAVVIPLAHAEFGPLGPVAPVDRELLAGDLQATAHHPFRDLDELRVLVDPGARFAKQVQHLFVGHVDADRLEDPN